MILIANKIIDKVLLSWITKSDIKLGLSIMHSIKKSDNRQGLSIMILIANKIIDKVFLSWITKSDIRLGLSIMISIIKSDNRQGLYKINSKIELEKGYTDSKVC